MVKLADEVRIIDADTHLTEPHDLLTSRRPEGLRGPGAPCDRDRRRAVPGSSTRRRRSASPVAAGVIDREGEKFPFPESMVWGIDWVHRAAFDPKARLELMDECGIYAQVLFPNAIGLGGQSLANGGR